MNDPQTKREAAEAFLRIQRLPFLQRCRLRNQQQYLLDLMPLLPD